MVLYIVFYMGSSFKPTWCLFVFSLLSIISCCFFLICISFHFSFFPSVFSVRFLFCVVRCWSILWLSFPIASRFVTDPRLVVTLAYIGCRELIKSVSASPFILVFSPQVSCKCNVHRLDLLVHKTEICRSKYQCISCLCSV
jgi:hypothetical protein